MNAVAKNTSILFIPYSTSKFVPFVVLHPWRRCSTLCQTFCNKGSSDFSRCSYLILLGVQDYSHWRNVNLCENRASQEEVEGVGSEDHGNQEINHPRPTDRTGNCLFKNVVISLWMCDGPPSPSANICSHEQFGGPNTNSDCTQLDSLYCTMFGTQSKSVLMCAVQQNSTHCT